MEIGNFDLFGMLASVATTYGLKLLGSILIVVIGRWAAKLVVGAVRRVMQRSDLEEMLINFVGNIVYWLLIAIIAVAALSNLGIPTTSAAAIIGAAGLAVGLALQDSLGNFAAGVMIIVFKPFTEGDYVEVAGTGGVVENVQLFTTALRTPDNKAVIVPNGEIISNNITNYTAKPTRRIDMVFGIGYDDDLREAKKLLEQILQEDDRILAEPAPEVAVLELADSSVNFAVRPHVKTEDYWPVYFYLTEEVKVRFDEAGISIPYPQRDIHLFQQEAAA